MEHMEHPQHAGHQPAPSAPKPIVINFDRRSFIAGIASGILILCAIGFFILLAMMISGKGLSLGGSQVLKKTAQAEQPAGEELAPAEVAIPDITTEDHLLGEKNAEVTIVEYSDIDCPFCKRFHTTLQQVVADNGGKVNWVYRHFPLASLHPDAPKKAEASECVAEQGGNEAFWNFLDQNMVDAGVSLASLGDAAAKAGVNKAKFQTCLDEGRYADKVQQQYDDAIASGGRGTPYSIIVGPDGTMIPLSGALPADQVQSAIDSLLNS